ncbi:MAG TPA: transglutaminase-like domain-containing protein, partial [Ignavibacteriales bacterium]|nr:transglutaminase-like domain-containing protein [Ignavibacteriales bacterium]
DLLTGNSSSNGVIHERTAYSLPLGEKNQEGDFVEFIYSVKEGFPSLGLSFSPAEAGMKADEVVLEIIVPDSYKLQYKSVNGSTTPAVSQKENNTAYTFRWTNYKNKPYSSPFEKLNNEPEIIASFSRLGENAAGSWVEFGNWYLDLISDKIKPNDEIKALAEDLTRGLTDPKEKMDAIFNYCQKNIRYEQVYIQGGEFIPNDCSLILKRKFGDCKDYSAIIYTLAKCAGVNASLALCFRGRGVEFYDIPASQFNHAIVHYFYKGKDYWYDGTNRISEAGLTTFDLANQTALVIEKDNSRPVKIAENEMNLFSITGELKEDGNGFLAELKLSFAKQYAIDFLYPDIFLNRTDMKDYITHWIKENLSRNISVSEMKWNKGNDGTFEVFLNGKLPNSFTRIAPACYTSFCKIFPDLFYDGTLDKDDELFYFPKFNRISLALQIPGMQNTEAASGNAAAVLNYSYQIPIGPFVTEPARKDFIEKYNGIYSDLHKKFKLTNRNAK